MYPLRIYLFGLLGLALSLSACDLANSGENENNKETQNIEGRWELTGTDGTQFLVLIDKETFTLYEQDNSQTCFYSRVLEITDVNNNSYTLYDPTDNESKVITITKDGDQLKVSRVVDGQTINEVYQSSSFIISNQDLCTNTISGLWELDNSEGSEGDVLFVLIDLQNDYVMVADYLGDSYDQEEDCYDIEEYNIISVEGNEYTLQNISDANDTFMVVVELTDRGMQVSEDDGGQQIVDQFIRSDRDPKTFEPVCS